jgi:hypothetical protein
MKNIIKINNKEVGIVSVNMIPRSEDTGKL